MPIDFDSFTSDYEPVMKDMKYCPVCASVLSNPGADTPREIVKWCTQKHLQITWSFNPDYGWELTVETPTLTAAQEKSSRA